jgi:hypothetical protein
MSEQNEPELPYSRLREGKAKFKPFALFFKPVITPGIYKKSQRWAMPVAAFTGTDVW